MNRANPFGDLAAEFTPKPQPKAKPVESAQIEQIAAENGFPSRKARPVGREAAAAAAPTEAPRAAVPTAVRRYTTGRNRQLNLKASDATIARFYRLADAQQITLAELFERAIDALEAAQSDAGKVKAS